MYHGVRVSIGKTNRNELQLLDIARRQADHLGPRGICAKRGQTNERYLEVGYLRFARLSRREAQKLERRINELNEAGIKVWRFKNRGHRRGGTKAV